MKKLLIPATIIYTAGFIVGIICYKNWIGNTNMRAANINLNGVFSKNITMSSEFITSITIKEESPDVVADDNLIVELKTEELQSQNIEEIVNIYYEFLKGNRIDEITVPTGEEGSHYPTKYAFSDVTGDDIPELHVNSARYYYVYKYNNGEIIRLLNLSPYPYYYALKNGGFICHRFGAGPKSDEYAFYIFDDMGNETIRICFSKYDSNQDFIYDDEDEYFFDGVEVTKEVWDGLTERYLYIDDTGIEQIRDEIEWTILYE